MSPPGTPLLQPTDERRRTGSHYTPRSLTEPIVQHALEPAFERIGPDAQARGRAGAEGLRSGDGLGRLPGRGLPGARRSAGARLGALARDAAEDSRRRGRAAARPPPRRPALPLRRRQEPARRRTRQAVALARDARARSRIHLPRSCAEMRRQPRRARREADRGDALGPVEAGPAAVPQVRRRPGRRGDDARGRRFSRRRTTPRAPSSKRSIARSKASSPTCARSATR